MSNKDAMDLIKPVTGSNIDDNKSPRIDRFNALFFKKTWHIVKKNFVAHVLKFF